MRKSTDFLKIFTNVIGSCNSLRCFHPCRWKVIQNNCRNYETISHWPALLSPDPANHFTYPLLGRIQLCTIRWKLQNEELRPKWEEREPLKRGYKDRIPMMRLEISALIRGDQNTSLPAAHKQITGATARWGPLRARKQALSRRRICRLLDLVLSRLQNSEK